MTVYDYAAIAALIILIVWAWHSIFPPASKLLRRHHGHDKPPKATAANNANAVANATPSQTATAWGNPSGLGMAPPRGFIMCGAILLLPEMNSRPQSRKGGLSGSGQSRMSSFRLPLCQAAYSFGIARGVSFGTVKPSKSLDTSLSRDGLTSSGIGWRSCCASPEWPVGWKLGLDTLPLVEASFLWTSANQIFSDHAPTAHAFSSRRLADASLS
jgi:hypothetical protein